MREGWRSPLDYGGASDHFRSVATETAAIWRDMNLAFLRRWPSPQTLGKSRRSTLKAFPHQHGSRSQERWSLRRSILEDLVPLSPTEPLSDRVEVESLAAVFDVLNATVRSYNAAIAELFQQQPAEQLAQIEALPEAGPAISPRSSVAPATFASQCASAEDLASAVGCTRHRPERKNEEGLPASTLPHPYAALGAHSRWGVLRPTSPPPARVNDYPPGGNFPVPSISYTCLQVNCINRVSTKPSKFPPFDRSFAHRIRPKGLTHPQTLTVSHLPILLRVFARIPPN